MIRCINCHISMSLSVSPIIQCVPMHKFFTFILSPLFEMYQWVLMHDILIDMNSLLLQVKHGRLPWRGTSFLSRGCTTQTQRSVSIARSVMSSVSHLFRLTATTHYAIISLFLGMCDDPPGSNRCGSRHPLGRTVAIKEAAHLKIKSKNHLVAPPQLPSKTL